uniref:Ig-like domain-containing protein n=1 Tax=Echeneis naucrates TaxID=173247 RepID=A0A665WND8_ECHNA
EGRGQWGFLLQALQTWKEENSMTLSCELSKPGLSVEWRKGDELLKNNFKYQIKNRNGVMELTIKNAQLEDSGLYSCTYGDAKTTAYVTITRKGRLLMKTSMIGCFFCKFLNDAFVFKMSKSRTKGISLKSFICYERMRCLCGSGGSDPALCKGTR